MNSLDDFIREHFRPTYATEVCNKCDWKSVTVKPTEANIERLQDAFDEHNSTVHWGGAKSGRAIQHVDPLGRRQR